MWPTARTCLLFSAILRFDISRHYVSVVLSKLRCVDVVAAETHALWSSRRGVHSVAVEDGQEVFA